jgi:uncharacterized damage-inducible protein DinB
MSNSYVAIVDQAIELLDEISLKEYQQKLLPHFSANIGGHVRHICDHFLALMNGQIDGHVDYNIRHRHNNVEQLPCAAKETLQRISDWLKALPDESLNEVLTVTSEIDISHVKSTSCHSTIARELVFVSSHAIHHYALIRIMCSMQNINVPEFFGYAPATITHINKTA